MSSMTSINCTINERPAIHERPREMSRGRGLDSSPASRHDRPVVSDSGPHRTVRNQSEANGGEALMRALYAEHAGPLLAFVLRLTRGDRQRAEDIVQETLLRAWRNADLLRDWEETSPRPWLGPSPGGSPLTATAVRTPDRWRHSVATSTTMPGSRTRATGWCDR